MRFPNLTSARPGDVHRVRPGCIGMQLTKTSRIALDLCAAQGSLKMNAPLEEFSIVGVGASAGGLEALTEFFQNVAADTGMGFVVITHLDPRHKSLLTELLGKQTSMPVHQVEDLMEVQPNNVYVIPPDKLMLISGRTLHLGPREPMAARLPIDGFFRSLAQHQQDRAVGIVLSGSGSDGSFGLGAIKEQGGTTFVQEPQSAEFDAMPRSAIASGSANFVFRPHEIGAAMVRIGKNLAPDESSDLTEGQLLAGEEMHFEKILVMLHHVVGIDFREYRKNSIRRRLRRRLVIQQIPNLQEYVRHLEENPEELRVLAQDFLIRVTKFFRDPEMFHALRHSVFPHLLRGQSGEAPIRVWVPACSSGEEVYSIAMCFVGAAEALGSHVQLQIFGSDVNPLPIEIARLATYPENIALDVSPEHLDQFFTRVQGHYQVRKSLRELCIFSVHDVTRDPPFGRMDLVSCRNLMIYFDIPLQKRVIPRLHFALRPEGYLVMGKSETASAFSHLFAPLDKKNSVYVRKTPFQLPASPERLSYGAAPADPSFKAAPTPGLQRHVDQTIARQYGPPALVVNEQMAIVYAHGEVERYVRQAPEHVNAEALEIADEVVRHTVRTAIAKIRKSGEAVRTNGCSLVGETVGETLDISIIPLNNKEGLFLVLLEPPGAEKADSDAPKTQDSLLADRNAGMEQLRQELRISKTHLRTLLSEHQAALEESSATNEELQSLNEELESAKEDVESSNAELTAVNKEMQTRNTDLNVARELAQATTDAISASLLVLDSDLRVVSANSTFFRTFHTTAESVISTPIAELGKRQWNLAGLLTLLRELVSANASFDNYEAEVDVPESGHRFMLLSGRRVEYNHTILLAIEDVTERRGLEERLRQSQKLESIGQLAGGVAHDFNNMLTGILGNASLILDSLSPGDRLRPMAEQVISGSERAASLTRQLLAYAGKGRFFLERVDVSKLVIATGQLIQASISRRVQVLMDLDQNPPMVLADSSQIQQIIMNLIINAAEAIGDANGTVRVTTGGTWVEANQQLGSFTEEVVAPGRYVCIEVQDDGCGMEEETKQKIFSPFFTTKFTGRGLGLASILGIARSHRGIVQVHSEPGKGSSFKVLLPETPGSKPEPDSTTNRKTYRGTGTVLLVDDEQAIREFSKSALERCGYSTLQAENGQLALDSLKQKSEEISLVVLDVTMPVMGGRGSRPDSRGAPAPSRDRDQWIQRGANTHAIQRAGYNGIPAETF